MKRKTSRVISVFLAVLLSVSFSTAVSYAINISSPVVKENELTSGAYSSWDVIQYGTYPQVEIVATKEQCGISTKAWADESGYKVNEDLYQRLVKADYDANGMTILGTKRYIRIKNDKSLYQTDNSYNWNGTPEYHYFRFEPIQWRVLSFKDGKALLLADKILDCKPLYGNNWNDSLVRKWLNNDFLNTAFSSEEKGSIIENDSDYVFLLQKNDVANTDNAIAYGFSRDEEQTNYSRIASSTTFASAKGVATYKAFGSLTYAGYSNWLLSSLTDGKADLVSGNVSNCAIDSMQGIRPSIIVDVEKADYTYIGKIVSNGTFFQTEGVDLEEKEDIFPEEKENVTPENTDIDKDATNTLAESIGTSEIKQIKLIKYNSVKLTWKAIKGVTQYQVAYKAKSDATWKIKETTSTSLKVTKLKSGKKYSFKIRGCKNTSGSYSKTKTIYTLKKVTAPKVTKISDTKAKVTWSKVKGADGYQFYSQNEYSGAGGYAFRDTTSLKSTNLYKGNNYRYKVRAYKLVNGKKIYAPWSSYRIYKHE